MQKLLTLVLLQSEGKGSGIMLACFVLEEYKGRFFLLLFLLQSVRAASVPLISYDARTPSLAWPRLMVYAY